MARYLVLSVACLFMATTAARGQDEIIKDFGPKQVEKFIADTIMAKAKPVKISDTITIYETPEGHYDLALRSKPGSKALIFRFPFKELKVTAKEINEWNGREGNQTRCYVSKEGMTILTCTVSLEAGVSFKQLGSIYSAIQKERTEFVEFLKAQDKGV